MLMHLRRVTAIAAAMAQSRIELASIELSEAMASGLEGFRVASSATPGRRSP